MVGQAKEKENSTKDLIGKDLVAVKAKVRTRTKVLAQKVQVRTYVFSG